MLTTDDPLQSPMCSPRTTLCVHHSQIKISRHKKYTAKMQSEIMQRPSTLLKGLIKRNETCNTQIHKT